VAYALPYFYYEDLPERIVDVEFGYFRRALDYLCARPEVDDSEGVGVIGTSKGSQVGFLMASECEKVRAIVTMSGLHVLTIEEMRDTAERTFPALPIPFTSGDAVFHEAIPGYALVHCWNNVFNEHDPAVREATIRVEKSHAAILMISGSDDGDWPASRSAQCTMERLQRHRYPYPYEHLCLVNAGHLIEPPYSPFTRFSFFRVLGGNMLWGGERSAHVQGERIAWRRTLEFFATHLSQPLRPQLTSRL
jgi:bile acid-CoA:amino acid N-acyltransferase